MRLINTTTLTLTEFHNPASTPPYAILSHTWSEDAADEVTFQQFTTIPHATLGQTQQLGFAKIQQTCRLALDKGLDWAWVDTCCIDKSSSAELTEAISSMWRWYGAAEVCFAFLADLELERRLAVQEKEDVDDEPQEKGINGEAAGMDAAVRTKTAAEQTAERLEVFGRCRWFTRGWTLQELTAPRRLEFYNSRWDFFGEKSSMSAALSGVTRIRAAVLRWDDPGGLSTISVAERMSWAAGRQTTRVEDTAYSLLGLFGVNMSLLYGEGDRAFIRLQEEIIKESNDPSLFIWSMDDERSEDQTHWGILAPSPREFASCGDIETWVDPMHSSECTITSKGLRVTPVPGAGLRPGPEGTGAYIMYLQCYRRGTLPRKLAHLGIMLRQQGCDVYTRMRPDKLYEAPPPSKEDKGRVFYVAKTVSPSGSAMLLRTSALHALNLSRALETLAKKWRFRPASTGAFEPEGHWDGQRGLFLTRGMQKFGCRVELTREDSRGRPEGQIALVCSTFRNKGDKHGSVDGVSVRFIGLLSTQMVGNVTLSRVGDKSSGVPMFTIEVREKLG